MIFEAIALNLKASTSNFPFQTQKGAVFVRQPLLGG